MIKSSDSLRQTLKALLDGRSLQSVWQDLMLWELTDADRATAFGITARNVDYQIRQRGEMLGRVYAAFCKVCDRHLGDPENYLTTLWQLWLPLAQNLMQQRQALHRPLIQGVLGGQGSGKTTLGTMLTVILQTLGYKTLSWSLDDLYKTYADRLQLQQQVPQLIWRGPPGTHDVDLGIQVLDHLRQPAIDAPIAIPRFDKSLHNGMGDRVASELVQAVDIVLFEGWFVGVQPVDDSTFDSAPPPIETLSDRAFAQDCNRRLQDYLPLWERLDRLWVLYLPNYQLSKQWRKQAEARMKAGGKSGMSAAEIEAFVEYFWKALHPELFIHPTLEWADLVIEVNSDHSPGAVYCWKYPTDE